MGRHSASTDSITVELLHVASQIVPGPQVFWMRDWHREYSLHFHVALLRGPNFTVLVNSGPGDNLAALNAGVEQRIGARNMISAQRPLASQLNDRGIATDDVTHVVCTPLQGYTTGGLLDFPNAEYCLSKRGWLAFHALGTTHPHVSRDKVFARATLAALVTDARERVRLLEDEDTIVDKVTCWWAGVHHRSSIVINTTSEAGPLAISDCFVSPTNVHRGVPPGFTESLEEAAHTYSRLRQDGRKLISLYDPGAPEQLNG